MMTHAKGVFTGGDGDALAPGVGALGEATEAAGGFRGCGTGIRVGHGSRRGRVLRGGANGQDGAATERPVRRPRSAELHIQAGRHLHIVAEGGRGSCEFHDNVSQPAHAASGYRGKERKPLPAAQFIRRLDRRTTTAQSMGRARPRPRGRIGGARSTVPHHRACQHKRANKRASHSPGSGRSDTSSERVGWSGWALARVDGWLVGMGCWGRCGGVAWAGGGELVAGSMAGVEREELSCLLVYLFCMGGA